MSIAGRVTKIDACLASTAVHQLALRLMHKSNIAGMEKQMRAFFWAGGTGKKKIHWVKWKWICKLRKKGGLGIIFLTLFNISLMCKWWWRLETGSGPWQSFMRRKYIGNSGIHAAKFRPTDSAFWSDMMHVREVYMCGRKMSVGNGLKTHFWKDAWCGPLPFKDRFPDLLRSVMKMMSQWRICHIEGGGLPSEDGYLNNCKIS